MTDQERDYEISHNEAVWVTKRWVLDIGSIAMWVIAPFINDETSWKVAEYFGKRGHYLKVGRLKYNWKDFDDVQAIYRDKFK